MTATVGGGDAGTPTGTVEFFSGPTLLSDASLSAGVAQLSTTALTAGSDSIMAFYVGDDTFTASASDEITQTVAQAGTSTTLATAPDPSGLGQSVTLTATVAPLGTSTILPTGTVQFLSGSNVLGTGTLGADGTATLTTGGLPLGTSTITAAYQGDTNYTASTSAAVTQTVGQGAVTVTLVGVNNQSPAFGDHVVLSYAVTAGVGAGANTSAIPTGAVEFLANAHSIGTANLDSNGQVSFDTTNLAIGSQVITAVYQGDANFAPGSTSAPLTITVGDGTQLYLNQLYIAVLHRPIDSAGLTLWEGQLNSGTSRKVVASDIVHSAEARTLGEQAISASGGSGSGSGGGTSTSSTRFVPVAQRSIADQTTWINTMYQAILGRPPESPGNRILPGHPSPRTRPPSR